MKPQTIAAALASAALVSGVTAYAVGPGIPGASAASEVRVTAAVAWRADLARADHRAPGDDRRGGGGAGGLGGADGVVKMTDLGYS